MAGDISEPPSMYHCGMPTDASVKAAAWQLYEAATVALRHLGTAADRGDRECRRLLRAAILAAGGGCPMTGTQAKKHGGGWRHDRGPSPASDVSPKRKYRLRWLVTCLLVPP